MFVYETKDAYVTCHPRKGGVVITFLPKRPGKKNGGARSVFRTKEVAKQFVAGLTPVN